MSNVVPAPQVWKVAVPDAAAVHRNTCSGALPVAAAQAPAWALVPLVVPVNAPPNGGSTRGLLHVPAAGAVELDDVLVDDEVLVVEEVVVDEDVLLVDDVVLVLELVVDVVARVVLVVDDDVVVVGGALVLEVVLIEEELVELLVVVVTVVAADGGVTLSTKLPLEPPHEPA